MAAGNWSEAGVLMAAGGTVTPGHCWRIAETRDGVYWISVYKDGVRVDMTDHAGNSIVGYGLTLSHGKALFAGVRILAHALRVGERSGVALLAWHFDSGEWMAAVSVEGHADTGAWLGCDAVTADVALGWMAGEMAERDPERWPALRAALVTAMEATRPKATPDARPTSATQ